MNKKDKRPQSANKVHTNTNIKIFSTNAAGVVNGKMHSLTNEIKGTQANIITIQETHSNRKGRIVMPDGFVTFEAIRKAKHGGTMCAVHQNFNPKLIETYEDPFELLVVEIEAHKESIRIITGCGPQENWDESRRMSFFIALEAEIIKAELSGKSIIIEIDANSKLGPELIPNDPHKMSQNGKILPSVIERHALIVANGSEKCKGLITRERSTKERTERSCIDIVMFSNDLKKHFKYLHIDDARKHVLTRITKTKKGVVIKESDHNVLITEFTCELNSTDTNRKVEVYNLKNVECQKKFKSYTSNTKMLSSIFDSEDNINILTQRFIKKLDGCIKTNFKKVRINKHKKTDDESLYTRMRELKGKCDPASKQEMIKVTEAIAEAAENKYKKLAEELSKMKPDKGRIDAQQFWKMKKRIFPKIRDLLSGC